MWIGNFDNRKSDSTHNPALQIETYEVILNFGFVPHLNIFDVNVPPSFSVPVNRRTDWLNQRSDNASGVALVAADPLASSPRQDILVPADIQGRSLRLGAPTIVRVTNQIQPDVVLAIPPMHVDWIAPLDQTLAQNNGCPDKTGNSPCAVNLSVLPDPPPASSSLGFATAFKFDGGKNL